MSRKARIIGSVVVFLAALTFFMGRVTDESPATPESPLDLAYRLCGQCGLEPGEVDTLIDNPRHTGLTRDEQIRLFEEAYIDGAKLDAAGELCLPCAEAVLDAVFKDHRRVLKLAECAERQRGLLESPPSEPLLPEGSCVLQGCAPMFAAPDRYRAIAEACREGTSHGQWWETFPAVSHTAATRLDETAHLT